MNMSDSVRKVFDYHEATKHHFNRYARGPGRLDWSSQPDPFRRYTGAPLLHLERFPPSSSSSGEPSPEPSYDLVFTTGLVPPAPLDFRSLSRLLFDSLALSAWKSAGGEAWPLRVNPSSGNLHPTEGYLICPPVPGLAQTAIVCHYAPKEHALELRAEISFSLWEKLTAFLPQGVLLIGLTSIHWREAWKYGERAYRYCQLDVGHALGAFSIAAGALGWRVRLLDNPGSGDLAHLMGVIDPEGAESEEPDCLLAVTTQGHEEPAGHGVSFDPELLASFRGLSWQGKPNILSRSHVKWPAIENVAEAARKPFTQDAYSGGGISESFESPPQPHAIEANTAAGMKAEVPETSPLSFRQTPLRRILHQRRSAVAMDGVTSMPRDTFYGILSRTVPTAERIPFATLPWPTCVHLALFVHRVEGLAPGLYFLVRDPRQRALLQAAMHRKFEWRTPEGCPEHLPLYLLEEGDVRQVSMQISCLQDIAGEGCFSVAMIAEFEPSVTRYGSWFYPRLFWECGMIGQVLYLEAEASNLRGTGIGCFFDDPTHELLGLRDKRYQDLYHFTLGGPVEDGRISTLPAYAAQE